ncbi:MAG: NINE protein [Planctomycetota bacterium]
MLLGGIGAHHFYLGRPILGVIYLLFCWTFIPALIAFIEGLVLLCTSDKAFAQRYSA